MNFNKHIILLFSFLILISVAFVNIINATPQISLWTGNRCSACHINMQGGNMRNEFGWKFSKEMTTFSIATEPLSSIYSFDKDKYSYFNKLLAFGLDFRYQSTRSHKSDLAVRKYYPMQASVYANSNPFDWLLLEGQFNVGKISYLDSLVYKHNMMYAGQQEWSASMFIKPSKSLPALRLGKFQPSMGLRDCDMTILDRRIAVSEGTEQLIAPDYSDYGAELIYEGQDWLTVNLGAYDSRNLSKVRVWGRDMSIVPIRDNPTIAAKVMFFPEWLWEDFPAAYIGVSSLVNGRFIYNNFFAGYSILPNLYLEAKYAGTKFTASINGEQNHNSSNNFIGQITYLPEKGIFLSFRAETGNTVLEGTNIEYYNFRTNQFVAGVKFIPVPFIELITEYRYLESLYYQSARWLFQLHLYY